MELAFEPREQECLRLILDRVVSQEETAEAIVPDSCPDIVRTVGCYGMPMLRSKECRDGAVILSGSVRAHALIEPEDESYPRALEVYLPFTQRIEMPELTADSRVLCELRLRSLDARLFNSSKVLVRAEISSHVEVFAAQELTTWALTDCPPELEVHRVTLPITVPEQTGEKPFVVGEELELPAGQPAAASVLKWDAATTLTEQKMIGTRAVFKGSVAVRMLYRAEDESVCRYEFAVPFSQFLELDRESGEDDLRVVLLCTGAQLEPDGQEPARRFLLELNLLAQCITQPRRELELIDDLYATHGAASARTEPFAGTGVLDLQHMRQTAHGMVECECSEVIDTAALLGWPETQRDGENVTVRIPAQVTVLYRDPERRLQTKTARIEAECGTVLADGCTARAQAQLSGDVFSSPSGTGAEARFTVDVAVESAAQQRCEMVTGGEINEQEDTRRPSVVIRAVEDGQTLWSIAKACRSRVAAVCAANGLDDEPAAGTLLLIPRT